jgi:transcriptional regulator with XRE-family HTH domain
VFAAAFGKVLKVARRQRGMKQDALAYSTGVRTSNVSNWETGKTLPSFAALMLISDAVQVPISRLFAAAERAVHLNRVLAEGGRITRAQDTAQHQEDTDAHDPQ